MKEILLLLPDNKWKIGTFDVSSAFFQGDTLERDVYVKNPEGPGYWLLNAALYRLREGARDWYDRFHRHCLGLGFNPAPGDPATYSYDGGWLAIHVHALTASGNAEFYDKVIVPLLSFPFPK